MNMGIFQCHVSFQERGPPCNTFGACLWGSFLLDSNDWSFPGPNMYDLSRSWWRVPHRNSPKWSTIIFHLQISALVWRCCIPYKETTTLSNEYVTSSDRRKCNVSRTAVNGSILKTNSFYTVNVCLAIAVIEAWKVPFIRPIINLAWLWRWEVILQDLHYRTVRPSKMVFARRSFPFGARPVFRAYACFREGRLNFSLLCDGDISDTICYKSIWKVDVQAPSTNSCIRLGWFEQVWNPVKQCDTFHINRCKMSSMKTIGLDHVPGLPQKNPAIQLRIISDGFPKNGKFGNSQYQQRNARFLNHQHPKNPDPRIGMRVPIPSLEGECRGNPFLKTYLDS